MDSPHETARPAQWRVALAGISTIGVSYGFARYGYGLFLPEIRREFDLSVPMVGFVGSATYAGYLLSLTVVGVLALRFGPRTPLLAAGVSAAAGMAAVALAPCAGLAVAGLVLAGTSSGWAWAPYSDAVQALVPERGRARILALLPTGTAFGTVAAGALAAVAAGPQWRYVWLGFAAAAAVVTVYNARLLPRRVAAAPASPPVSSGPRLGDGSGTGGSPSAAPCPLAGFLRPAALPLYLTAFSYGLVGAVYWTFAVELVSAGAADSATAPLFWTLMGLAGIGGLLSAVMFARLGLRASHTVLFVLLAAALALLGAAPGALPAAVLSAVLYGPAFMAVSGLLAVWSLRVFPARPTVGFSVTVFFLGVGTVVGPAAAGALADDYGLAAVFLLTAALAAATPAARPEGVRAGA